ncbi:hypothetical protein AWW66_03155 [Micromonospora rosaria]|uniref:Uncharacterized protein n=1 Tax=Micromonospora rosaria TaxID=47874 RepID=A0A136PYQ0_9ACTN|nr:hypothetical protein [Micromonospora rosaria]KXK63326.1 hypothetical protein AWW66_03155 [Micromonospora rosaria]
MMRAAVYGPARDIGRWHPVCAAWCTKRGYQLLSVVDEVATASRWGDVLRMMADREVDVVVVATLADLPQDRLARVEIIGRGRPARRPGLRAVVYGPTSAGAQWARRGVRWCQEAGYHVRDVVAETPDASRWPGVVRLMADRSIDLVVMESWGHLPPHRVPRVEVVGVDPPGLLQPRAVSWYE